jgi:hypothetical protein
MAWKCQKKIQCTAQHFTCLEGHFMKNQYFFGVFKKIKFSVKKIKRYFLSFLQKNKNMLVFHKTWHVHTEYRDVRVNFLFRIFFTFQNIFSGGTSIWSHVQKKLVILAQNSRKKTSSKSTLTITYPSAKNGSASSYMYFLPLHNSSLNLNSNHDIHTI